MTVVESCHKALGAWMGTNRLRLTPDDPYRDSESTATVAQTAGVFVTVAYTWVEEGEPQDGLLVVGDGDALRMTMDNILPESMVGGEGEGTVDYQAVEATYTRR